MSAKFKERKLLSLLLLIVWLSVDAVHAAWDSQCPQNCKCTYISNRKVIKCSKAGYTTIPTSLSAEVQTLDLSDNNIGQLHSREFMEAGLDNLQKLVLSGNEINYVHRDAFQGLKILIDLDLSNNNIDRLHGHTFTGMEKLRMLDLSGNQLTRLDPYQFPRLLHLGTVKLNGCNIQFISNLAFANLPNLTTIELADNIIETLQPDAFESNTKLLALELGSNRWNCDCRLRPFANWMRDHLDKNQWQCFSPARLKDSHWQDVPMEDFACEPSVDAHQETITLAEGSHGSLNCWATGDPLPTIKWITGNKVLSNLTLIGESSDHYVVRDWVNRSVVHSTLQLGIYGDKHPTQYACVASNPANSVKKEVQVVIGTEAPADVVIHGGPSVYVLIGVGVSLIVLILLLIIIICCCYCRRRNSRNGKEKGNGVVGNGSVMVVPSNPINPVNKPPRQYEPLPQKELEMTHLSNSTIEGGHKSYEELNYPSGGHSIYSGGRLPTLEEEGTLLSYAPSIQSSSTQQTDFPDILNNARVPQTVSPTHLSYHTLAYPPTQGAEWRFSYAHPTPDHYGVVMAAPIVPEGVTLSSTPQHTRPGYVTLPRRPRTPSWSGATAPLVPNPPMHTTPHNAIYDTLGPRTTADGTSTTDLTRPGSRAALYEPLPPSQGGPHPTSPKSLAAHYTSQAAVKQFTNPRMYNARPGVSQTLPRPAPNYLNAPPCPDLGIPHYSPAPEMQPLIEPSNLGIPYTPPTSYSPFPTNESLQNNNMTPQDIYGMRSPAPVTSASHSPSSHFSSLAPEESSSQASSPSPLIESGSSSPPLNNNPPPPSGGKKKVPPKPPPKPSSKRLSVTSMNSDAGMRSNGGAMTPQFIEEGPDGSEV